MIQEGEIRQMLAGVVRGSISLDQLHAWLDAQSINMHNDSEPSATRLASLVDVLLAERFLGDRSDGGVKAEFAQMLRHIMKVGTSTRY